jgi:hypothetical protein
MTAEDDMRALWDTIPDAGCLGACQASCGPIGATPLEYSLLNRHSLVPFPSINEQFDAFRLDHQSYHCPLLVDGICTAYQDRPTICRLWGSEETMPCPWGCKPRRPLTHEEGSEILQRSLDIGGELDVLG